MAKTGVYVDGLNETVRGLERAGVDVNDLKDVFAPIAAEAADVAQGFTPVHTGALRATVRGNRAKNKAVVTFGKARVPYAGPILYGWKKRGISPSYTVRRTDNVMDNKAPQMLEAGLEDVFKKYGLI